VKRLHSLEQEGEVTLVRLLRDGRWMVETYQGVTLFVEQDRLIKMDEWKKEQLKKYGY
jgi:hypothetical protein